MNKTFVVEYTTEECIGNETLVMNIDAPDLSTAYEMVNDHYPEFWIDQIYLLVD